MKGVPKWTVSFLVTALVVLTTGVSEVWAQQPSVDGYGGVQGGVQSQVQAGGSLPFTGVDLVVLFGGAMVLMAVGLVVRRLARP